MILVDTSVIIGLLRGEEDNSKVALFRKVIERDLHFGISSLTYQEILQGAKNEKEFVMLEDYLGSQNIYFLPEDTEYYTKASKIFFTLRRGGMTPRGTIDVLIAATAIEHGLYLLHDDKDFDAMKVFLPELKILDGEASLFR